MKDFFEVDVQYSENLQNLYKDLPFLPERMKIEKVLYKKIFFCKFISNRNEKNSNTPE